MREWHDRLRSRPAAEAVALAGLGMVVVGVAVTVEALIEAARSTPGAGSLEWYDRLLLGLWEFRIEHALWFTAGLLALWWALAAGARMEGWADPVGRLAAGLAVGYALVAAAVAVGSTVVAVRGSIGGEPVEIAFSDRERLLVWLLQTVTAVAAGGVWALIAARLGESLDAREVPAAVPGPVPIVPDPEPERELPPPPPEPIPRRPAVAPDPEPDPEPPPEPEIAAVERAARIFQDRLAYSPRRVEAQVLLERITAADRAGRTDEVETLLDELAAL